MRLTLSGIFKCSDARPILAKILRNFTDKSLFSEHLSVIKTHFTDKQSFLPILSVIAIFRAGRLRTEDPFSLMCP